MTAQQVRKYIDRILGKSVRLLLPSYWWKKVFSLVLDRIEQIVPIVDSKKELEKLDMPKGSVASVVGDLHSFSECFLIHSLDDDVDETKFTVIPSIVVTARDVTNEAFIWLSSYENRICLININSAENTIEALIANANLNTELEYTLLQSGELVQSGIDAVNEVLSREKFVYNLAMGEDDSMNSSAVLSYVDKYIKWGGGASAYIKGKEWQRLAKEDEIPYINMSVINGKQDKLVSGENIKTINGQSILGEGDISLSFSVDQSMSDTSTNAVQNKVIKAYVDSKVNMPVEYIYNPASAVISPNVYTVFGNTLQTTTISLETADSSVVNDYVIEFKTAPSGEISIDFPSDIKWANGIKPQFENDATYQISIIRNLAVVTMFI